MNFKENDIIALCGYSNSGKDTVAKILVEQYAYTDIAFAKKLKDCVAVLFDWDRKMLDGRTPEHRATRLKVDEFWAEELGIPEFTPIYALERIGTECMRENLSEHIWVSTLKHQLRTSLQGKKVVITDLRLTNEYKMIKNLGGSICNVHREDNLQDWMFDVESVIYSQKDLHCEGAMKLGIETFPDIHKSRYEFLTFEWNYTIYNNETILDLDKPIRDMLESHNDRTY